MYENIKKAILSGGLVGLGVIANTMVENKYVGSMLFSFALLTIIYSGLSLYTGKIGFALESSEQRKKRLNAQDADAPTPSLRLLSTIIGNFVGVLIPVLLLMAGNESFREQMFAAATGKFEQGYLQMFIDGILCGVMMFIAVYSKKEIIVVFCIMIFILCGFEHCIAVFPCLPLNFTLANLLKFVLIVAGNSVGSIGTAYFTGNATGNIDGNMTGKTTENATGNANGKICK